MILGNLESLPYRIIALLVAVTIHEFAHAWAADRLGDPTPRMRGRLSLNPIVHLDLLGSLLLIIAGFGWAKPVEVNPRNFSDWRRGMLVTAAAGPLSNVLLLFLVGFAAQFGLVPARSPLAQIVFWIMLYNAVLAVFNMIPVPPLDGSRILSNLLPPRQAIAYDRLAAYGPLLLLVLILLPGNVFGFFMQPAINWLISRALGAGSLL
jgi:Zn-dependent protease